MRELLPDNIALADRLATLPSNTRAFDSRPTAQREIPSIVTWCCAFSTYVAILSQAHPELVVSRLAYMGNLMKEASRFGGEGWRTYDHIFRSQAAADTSKDWTELSPSLMLSYMHQGQGPPARYATKPTTRPTRVLLPHFPPRLTIGL